jgi:predicted DCC family thiol-disulfide oxidoreductase YuxK
MSRPRELWVLYDAGCGFCCRCREWLEGQSWKVPLRFLDRDAPEAEERFPGLRVISGARDELAVADSCGNYWLGAKAWLVCLWALRDYRAWSRRLASPMLRPLARRLYSMVSSSRYGIAEAMGMLSDRELAGMLASEREPGCAEGATCRAR